jgi:serine/threonine protein kinase
MSFLHNSGILHRDLQSANVLVDQNTRCKIAGFGLSEFCHDAQPIGVLTIPHAWMEPELVGGHTSKFSKASDMYSFGVIVWEIFSQEIPWEGFDALAISIALREQKQLQIRDSWPSDVRKFLSSCFSPSSRRPSFGSAQGLFEELVSHQPKISDEEIINRILGGMENIGCEIVQAVGGLIVPLQESIESAPNTTIIVRQCDSKDKG